MSRLAEFREIEKQIAEQLARLEEMKGDEKLKAEMVFEEKLRALMSKYDKNLRDVIAILDPDFMRGKRVEEPVRQRRERQVKVYVHPDTGERVETKGGNHKILKAWKSEFGDEMVESWRE